jgi:integrase
MVVERIAEIKRENGGHTANRARASLSAMFVWAMKDGKIKENPVAATNRPHEEKRRERVLDPAELAAIWNAAGDDAYGRIVKVLMLTGLRRREIGSMRWTWLDAEAGELRVPGEYSKNGVAFTATLVPEVVALIEGMPRMHDTVWAGGREGFNDWSAGKRRLDARLPGMKPWTLHDLRRTCASTLADDRFDVSLEVIKAILNHTVAKGATAVYVHARFMKKKREALERWAGYITGLVTGTVVALRVA